MAVGRALVVLPWFSRGSDAPVGTEVAEREVPAPDLVEVARIWWDVDVTPVVRWRNGGSTYVLADPTTSDRELLLATFAHPVEDPAALARVLAAHLAACDFPPTEDRASVPRVAATLAAAGRDERPMSA